MVRRRLPPTVWVLLLALPFAGRAPAEVPPPGLKLAFLGDQGLGPDSVAVLELIAEEGADAVLHLGDFDYGDDPAEWDAQIDSVLGPDYPYFALVGNHDESYWSRVGGYQDRIEARLQRLDIGWSGDLGAKSTLRWRGLELVMTSPGVFGAGDGNHDLYLEAQLAASDAVWRISAWHKNQHLMQAGGKSDETGWGVYEASRRSGAVIATAHEHSYSRTHLLSSMQTQAIASTASPLVLERDDPETPADEGRSFAFVSGLGGQSIRDQEVFGAWFASVYSSTQGATHGALFAVFHASADPRLARFYFKDVDGRVVDEFWVRSLVGVVDCDDVDGDGVCDAADDCTFVANPSQLDADLDGYGNACDADYGNDGWVGTGDFVAYLRGYGAAVGDARYDPELDANGDGAIGSSDFHLLRTGFARPPGPSSLPCAGSTPCAAP